ncbi:MAG: TIM barrel protein [Acidimicrobiales bacterium]|nr:TIM barrel protein [Acidimicrobiales bacterium]
MRSDEIVMCAGTLLADPMAATVDDIVATLEASASAGCPAVSLWGFWADLCAGAGRPLRAEFDRLGLRVGMLEAAMAWVGGDTDETRAEAARLAAQCADLGARRLMAVTMEPRLESELLATTGLAALAEELSPLGVQVAVEFLPWSGIPDLATAWRIVEPVPTAGIVLDAWHWQRQPGGPAFDLLASIPGGRIHVLQLDDAGPPADVDPMVETMTDRRLPGEGVVDLPALLAALDAIGADPVLAPEVFSAANAADGPAEAARRIVEATRRVVGA